MSALGCYGISVRWLDDHHPLWMRIARVDLALTVAATLRPNRVPDRVKLHKRIVTALAHRIREQMPDEAQPHVVATRLMAQLRHVYSPLAVRNEEFDRANLTQNLGDFWFGAISFESVVRERRETAIGGGD